MKLGDNQHSAASANLQTLSKADAAKLVGVSERSVNTAWLGRLVDSVDRLSVHRWLVDRLVDYRVNYRLEM
jgi:hypothetical protein